MCEHTVGIFLKRPRRRKNLSPLKTIFHPAETTSNYYSCRSPSPRISAKTGRYTDPNIGRKRTRDGHILGRNYANNILKLRNRTAVGSGGQDGGAGRGPKVWVEEGVISRRHIFNDIIVRTLSIGMAVEPDPSPTPELHPGAQHLRPI
jgi:hypothetical protein